MRGAATVAFWCISLATLAVAAFVATEFVFMATSMDPTDIVTEGVDTWWDAGDAIAGFVALLVVTAISLGLWHTARFRLVATVLAVADIAGVSWACIRVYTEYF